LTRTDGFTEVDAQYEALVQEFPATGAPDMGTFYTPGEKGYTDYPALSA
jgi:hypothetical protein